MNSHFKSTMVARCLVIPGLLVSASVHAMLPSDVPGLRLWLSADSGVTTNASGQVSAWADRTTNDLDVAQSTSSFQPLWVNTQMAGRPVLRFDGQDALQNTVSNVVPGGQARTVFVVARSADTNGGALFQFRTGVGEFALEQFRYTDGNWYIYSDGICCNETTANQTAIVTNAFLATYRSVGTGNLLQEWLNTNSVVVSGQNVATETAGAGFTVGFRGGTGQGWNGDIAEILVYDSALSDADRTGVEQYLYLNWIVPEPSSVILLGLGAFLLSRRNQFRK